MGKRHQVLREVIASEFRQGNFDRADEDEIVSICYRLIRDAEEGVAKNNLRLMARVINGMADKDELRAPTFLRYAPILSSLTEEEISILAVMMRFDSTRLTDTWAREREHALLEISTNIEEKMQALIRTGLVIMHMATAGWPTQKYQPTELMKEILEYADLAIQREAA
jgi:hypothetical protein